MTDDDLHTGRCLCGGVQYAIRGPLRAIVACHCSQCRRTSGHFAAMTCSPSAALRLTRSDSLNWYRSSENAERGFCNVCGGNLFWRKLDRDTISVTAGTLDLPTGLEISEHIYVADKSDYYALDDGVHQLLAE
jgi:hypothetical protein